MRLNNFEKNKITTIARQVYGDTVQVYLFGSRVFDSLRGGDIDLLIRTEEAIKGGILATIRFKSLLKLAIGEQKIDVVGDHEEGMIVVEAVRKGQLIAH